MATGPSIVGLKNKTILHKRVVLLIPSFTCTVDVVGRSFNQSSAVARFFFHGLLSNGDRKSFDEYENCIIVCGCYFDWKLPF